MLLNTSSEDSFRKKIFNKSSVCVEGEKHDPSFCIHVEYLLQSFRLSQTLKVNKSKPPGLIYSRFFRKFLQIKLHIEYEKVHS